MKNVSIILGLLISVPALCADEPPPVTTPRATSGDTAVEPDWSQRLTITVGPAKADLVGDTEKVIQAGVDYVARLGGGTVKIMPGVYKMRNSVYLQSKVRMLGAGADSVLVKEPSVKSKLAADSDWYDQEITLDNAAGFRVGDGVCLRAKNAHNNSEVVIKRTLIARTGNRFKLDRPLRENLWNLGNAYATTLFPIVCGENTNDCVIEKLTLDGNRGKNDNLDGNYAGCIFLQDCSRITVRGVTARNFNGDGISWQICHDVRVEDCISENNAQLGLHPGSGSQRPIIRNNQLRGNDIGIFFCWGVKYGLAEKNTIEGNRVGISIGHRDTDNLIANNEIRGSKEVGVLFRPERGKDFAGNRNRLVKNRLIDNGGAKSAAIDIQGATEAIVLIDNEITETRPSAERIGVRLGALTRDIQLKGNRIEGFTKDVVQVP
jgi:parallel beta-helix repeat protein